MRPSLARSAVLAAALTAALAATEALAGVAGPPGRPITRAPRTDPANGVAGQPKPSGAVGGPDPREHHPGS